MQPLLSNKQNITTHTSSFSYSEASWNGLKVTIRPTEAADLPSWKECLMSLFTDRCWLNPFAWYKRIYNTVTLLTRQLKRIDEVMDQNPDADIICYPTIEPGKYFSFCFHNDHFIKWPAIMKAGFVFHRHSLDNEKGLWCLKSPSTLFHKMLADQSTDGSHNVLTCLSQEHKRLRSILTKNLSEQAIKSYIPALLTIANQLVNEWKNHSSLILTDYTQNLAASSIAKILGHPGPYQKISQAAVKLSETLMNIVWKKKLDGLEEVKAIIQEELQKASENPTGVSIFRNLEKEEEYTDAEKRELSRLLFIAGQETFSASITHFLWFLARHKDLQTQIRDQMIQVIEANKDLDFKTFIKSLTLLKTAYQEDLRCHTPTWVVNRIAKKDLTIIVQRDLAPERKYFIKKGEELSYLIYVAARDQRIVGANPREFDINRPEENKKAHLGFGYGPHNCPGQHLVKLQALIYTAVILFHFELSSPLEAIQLEPKISLGIKNKIPLQLNPAHVKGLQLPNA